MPQNPKTEYGLGWKVEEGCEDFSGGEYIQCIEEIAYTKEDIFTDFAYEKMKEDLAFRNVRKAIRQKEMLAAAKYPPRMADSILTVTRKKSSKKSDVSEFNI